MWPFSTKKKPEERKFDFRTQEYREFIEDEDLSKRRETGFYEKLAAKAGSIRKIELGKKIAETQNKDIMIARLNTTPGDIGALFVFSMLILIAIFLPISIFLAAANSPSTYLIWVIPLFWAYYVLSYPGFKAQVVRIQASDASLRVVLYMAMFLELQPNLEAATRFATQHITGPLKEDMTKLMWDVEVGVYSDIKRAYGHYMELWLWWSEDFVRSVQLLIDSLLRVGGDRRKMLEKSLSYILDTSLNNMKDYARNLSMPTQLIHAMGILLPMMGLLMFPMISIFLHEDINPSYLVVGYIFLLPAFLFFLIRRLVLKRPGAFSHPPITGVSGLPPEGILPLKIGKNIIYLPLKLTAAVVAFVILIPGLVYFFSPAQVEYDDGNMYPEGLFNYYLFTKDTCSIFSDDKSLYDSCFGKTWKIRMLREYNVEKGVPLLQQDVFKNMMMTMTIIWGVSIGLYIYYYGRSFKKVQLRKEVEQIEKDLFIGLTALENALANGIPIERSLYQVVDEYEKMRMESSPLHRFFLELLTGIERMGYTFKMALFSGNYGILKQYPSLILKNIMQIIVNSLEKGTDIVTHNISIIIRYLENMSKVEQLIKDILDETVSSLKFQAMFIAPFISGIVAAMATVMVEMLYKISLALAEIEKKFDVSGTLQKTTEDIVDQIGLVKLEKVMAPTETLLVVGLYVVELSLLLSYFTNGIEHGFDDVNRDMLIARTLKIGILLFTVVVICSLIIFLPFIGTLAVENLS